MCDMLVFYVSILCEPDLQYLLAVGSTEELKEGISSEDILQDPDMKDPTGMQ
jgi:hypothetical protein